MKIKIRTIVIYGLFAGLSLFALDASAQTAPADSLDGEVPFWVTAMDNESTVNFFDAVEDFEQYWEKHGEPDDDSGVPSSGDGEEEVGEYATAYKRFIFWRMENEAYVRPDGSIPSKEEKLKIWKHLR